MTTPQEFIAWRNQHGFSQEAAAARIGVATVTLQSWERGQRVIRPYVSTAMRLIDEQSKMMSE